MFLKKFLGDKAFYKMVMVIVLPIIIQNAITTFVNMLDNIMVGQIGTLPMSAVSISNELLQIVNFAIIGSVSAIGIYGAQFFGKKDMKGVLDTVHIKLGMMLVFIVLGFLVFIFGGDRILHLYMDESTNTPEMIQEALVYAKQYISIMMFGMIPFGLSMVFGTISRESGKTIINMYSSIAGVLTNFVLNYCLIFGHFGFPRLGVTGAAIATLIARVVEFGVVLYGLYYYRAEFTFLKDILKPIPLEKGLLKPVLITAAPLTLNEIIWSSGMAMITQCYSTRGLEGLAAMNITRTITGVFSIAMMAMGSGITIIVGQRLGAGKIEEAKEIDVKLCGTAVIGNVIMGLLLFFIAPLFPSLYNTTDAVRTLAGNMLRIAALWLPLQAIYYCCYFTLRTGGKTFVTFLFDSGYTIAVALPTAYLLTRFTGLDILMVYLLVTLADIPKIIIGLLLLKYGRWANNLVG